MSFKNKLLQLYAKYDLNPTSLSRKLGYDKSEKISRLTRDENNSPSMEIIQDILNAFPQINARWLLQDEDDDNMLIKEDRVQYGFCKECIKKDGIIEFLKKECAEKDRRIRELTRNLPGGNQGNEPKKKAV